MMLKTSSRKLNPCRNMIGFTLRKSIGFIIILCIAALLYCPGGFNYEKMSAPSKAMMKMFVGALKAKKDKTEEEKIMVEMISKSYDISDKKYIEPIVKWAKGE